jgi:Fic family protein
MWIHEQKDWPKFTWDLHRLAPKLMEIRYEQGKLLGRMESLGFSLKQEASLHTLTNDIVKSSAIEGEILNPEEVRSSIARRLGMDIGGLLPTSRDVEGIVEIMLDATQHYQDPLTVERLFAWHCALFPTGRSGMRRITVGDWRSLSAGPMQVVSGPIGREKVHFEAPIASRIDREMTLFLEAFESMPGIDPILKAGLMHFCFVTIHPFEDGNGRIARAIAHMALARADGTSDRFYSMSAQIEMERKEYYLHLERQQRGDLDLTIWLDWFLECLASAIARAEVNLSAFIYKAKLWAYANLQFINDRKKVIIDRMLNDFKGHMSTAKYAQLAKCSPDTALRDIQDLVTQGVFMQNAQGGRSTSYRLANLEEVEELMP